MSKKCLGPGGGGGGYLGATRQCTYKRNIEALLCNRCCRGNAISVLYSECASVATVIQHAERMRRIMLLYLACLAVPLVSRLSHKRHDFRRKKELLNMRRVF